MARAKSYAAAILLIVVPGTSLAEQGAHVIHKGVTQSIAVSFADLNLANDAGVRRLTHRVRLAAAIVCDVPTYEVPQSIAQPAKRCFNDSVARASNDIQAAAARARGGQSVASSGLAMILLARR